jgi:hypothetical protein
MPRRYGQVSSQGEIWPENAGGAVGFGAVPKPTTPTGAVPRTTAPVVTDPGNNPHARPKPVPPVVVPPKDDTPPPPVDVRRPPDVAGDRKPAATQSVTGQKPIPIPRTNNGEGMNMATWVHIWEEWGREMLRVGFLPDQLPAIAEAQGEHFPKSLVATFNAQDQLGPRADMLQQYDLAAGQQRSYPHINADYPEGTGFGEWQAIPDNVRSAQNDFFNWAYDPANAAWIDKFGGHAYAAWMASPSGRGAPFALQKQQGFGTPVTPTTPVPPVPVVPVPEKPAFPDSPTATASIGKPKSMQQITNELSAYGNPVLGGGGGDLSTMGFGGSAGSATSGNYGRVSTGGPRVTSATRRNVAQPSLYPTKPTAGSTGAIRYQ